MTADLKKKHPVIQPVYERRAPHIRYLVTAVSIAWLITLLLGLSSIYVFWLLSLT